MVQAMGVETMTNAYDLANLLLIRMKEVDPQNRSPDGDDYNLLWDAILDEVRAICPDLDYGAVLQPESATTPQTRI
jgi:hypothetical protein